MNDFIFQVKKEASHFPLTDKITLIYHRVSIYVDDCIHEGRPEENIFMKCKYCKVYDSFPLLLVAFWPGIFFIMDYVL